MLLYKCNYYLYVFNSNNGTRRNLHSLSFDYEFKYDNDVVYFANCIPYFYSKLMKELNYYELNEEKYPYFQRKTIATTLGGNDLDMFTKFTVLIQSMKEFSLETFEQTNKLKCARCIYEPACDRGLIC